MKKPLQKRYIACQQACPGHAISKYPLYPKKVVLDMAADGQLRMVFEVVLHREQLNKVERGRYNVTDLNDSIITHHARALYYNPDTNDFVPYRSVLPLYTSLRGLTSDHTVERMITHG